MVSLIKAMVRALRRLPFAILFAINHRHIHSSPTINGYTRLNRNTSVGKNCNFNGFVVYGDGSLKIGDNFHSGSGCRFFSQVHNYEGECIPYDSTYKYKHVVIEDNVWLGADVTILGGCTVGEGAIIQACSVVVSDIPKFAIAGGNPARVFATRDVDHYLALKERGAFN